MSADVNSTAYRQPDPIDYANYDEGKPPSKSGGKKVFLPPKGRHTLRTVGIDCNEDTRTKENYLKATLTLQTVAPGQPFDGHEIRFVNLSTKKYSNREGNTMNDYLRAFGIDAQPQTDAEYVALVNRTLNGTFEAGLNWEAKDPDTQEAVAKDESDFPLGDDGNRLQFLTKKNDPQNGRIWARARVTYYASKVPRRT